MEGIGNIKVGTAIQRLADVLEQISWNPSFGGEEVNKLLDIVNFLSAFIEVDYLPEELRSLKWKSYWDVLEACRLLRVLGTRIKVFPQPIPEVKHIF